MFIVKLRYAIYYNQRRYTDAWWPVNTSAKLDVNSCFWEKLVLTGFPMGIMLCNTHVLIPTVAIASLIASQIGAIAFDDRPIGETDIGCIMKHSGHLRKISFHRCSFTSLVFQQCCVAIQNCDQRVSEIVLH